METTSSSPFKPRQKDKDEDAREEDDAQAATVEHMDASGEPQKKLLRLSETFEKPHAVQEVRLNDTYQQKETTQWLQTAWTNEKSETKEEKTGAQVFGDPFQICLLPEMLLKGQSQSLVAEITQKVQWSRKQMDLYEFYQSTDLSNMPNCRLLTNFLQVLRKQVRPWLEKVTGLKLDYVSASCSMYTCGDYLLVHDDLLKDRQVAFIYYLSPWEGAEEWTDAQGGCLEVFNSDEQCFPQFPVQRKIAPKDNQFAFFKVGSRSFHQVGEVTTFDYPRLTINGWFHGETNEAFVADSLRAFPRQRYLPPDNVNQPPLGLLLNNVYLKSATRRSIQKRIEENSEICLYEFFKRERFEMARSQLMASETLKWRRQGPANAHNYEVLDLSTAKGTIQELLQLFRSHAMFDLLRDFTDLDLAGSDADQPTCSVEIQRWSHGNYTVLGDGLVSEENTLDLVYYLNAADGAAVITYLSPDSELPEEKAPGASRRMESEGEDEEDESVLLTITPVDNALNIVYRCEGTTKFTKYVSCNTPLEKGPVFVISCSYKE
ncbi:prolyl 3-hydroxylase sudestada1-like isoform X1 [Drosophila bipectinata]|uniref:prolyl 3-hydroxylase sudestada1-like isoform X1 n=2 Tax=Drosophila bipectinata TaxID=42026 RepID=UPI001C89F32A|nr:prolyl 3-hydroxylase sudestada1-like isoform X1 [Drosophila bipectinata]